MVSRKKMRIGSADAKIIRQPFAKGLKEVHPFNPLLHLGKNIDAGLSNLWRRRNTDAQAGQLIAYEGAMTWPCFDQPFIDQSLIGKHDRPPGKAEQVSHFTAGRNLISRLQDFR